MAITLGKRAVKAIGAAVDDVFDRVTHRYLGPQARERGAKRLFIGYRPDLTLQALYRAGAAEERTRPMDESVQSLVNIARGYLDLNREKTKMSVVRAVESFLRDAEVVGGAKLDMETVLGGQLADIWGTTSTEVTKILDSEATRGRNLGLLEGITKVNASLGVDDPRIFFVVVRDGLRCSECTNIHLLEDKITPKIWLMSEITSGYHQRGDDRPSWSGLHPHCRCTPATMMKGYGFDAGGLIQFKGLDYDEFARQRE